MSKSNIVSLAKDLAVGKLKTTDFSVEDANDSLRLAIGESLGLDMDNYKMTEREFHRNSTVIFQIIEEVLDKNLDLDLRNQFEDWVEYRNYALGDKPEFYMPDDNIFKVAVITNGTNNLLRQRMRGGQSFTINVKRYGVKIYEELDRFLAGRIDWNEMIRLVTTSFALQVRDDVMKAILDNFPEVGAEYKLTKTGTNPSEIEVLTLAQRVKARTRQNVAIYGTLLALHGVKPEITSDAQNGERNATGYYNVIAGIPMYQFEQSLVNGTDDFLVPDDFLLVLPETRDKMIKVVNEGESRAIEGIPEQNASEDLEYTMTNKMGIAIIPSSVYGYIGFN